MSLDIGSGTIKGQNLTKWLEATGLAIIKASTPSSNGPENHFMLATGQSNQIVYANDLWTGTKVAIDLSPNNGTITQIMFPVDGLYYAYSGLLQGTLPMQVMKDFQNTTPLLHTGQYAYTSLQYFYPRSSETEPTQDWLARFYD